MRPEHDGDGVQKTQNNSKLDRVAKVYSELTASTHGGQTVPKNDKKRITTRKTLTENVKKCKIKISYKIIILN